MLLAPSDWWVTPRVCIYYLCCLPIYIVHDFSGLGTVRVYNLMHLSARLSGLQDFVLSNHCFVNLSSSSERGQCVELASYILSVDNLIDHGIILAVAPLTNSSRCNMETCLSYHKRRGSKLSPMTQLHF